MEPNKRVYHPPGIEFTDANNRHMMLVTGGPYEGWFAWKHPDGQWVSLRKATDEERAMIESKSSLQFTRESGLFQRPIIKGTGVEIMPGMDADVGTLAIGIRLDQFLVAMVLRTREEAEHFRDTLNQAIAEAFPQGQN